MLEDLLLAELALQLSGQQRLLELADDGAVLAEEHRARQLLRDRAGTFLHRAAAHVAQQRSADAHRIDAVVLVEAAIFRGNEGPLHQQWHLAADQLFAGGRAQLLDHLPIG